ncbi:hypothetical protein PC116_g27354 [Phytophthora cactorum]|nr:hypothetical protein PC116_g27354 [Phytophthora cactorum]
MMRSVTAAIRRPAALGRNHPAVSSSKLFSSDSSPSSSSSSYNAESAARTLKLLERRKVSTLDIGIFKRKKKPITMVTAYDYPSAVHVDLAGFDILLVGDSLGMVELGMDTTLPVTLDDMIHHTQAVKRGATRPLVITDMPFGTCEGTPFEALKNAQRLMKEGAKRGADCVKIEGGRERAETIKTIVDGGIAVMGHIGLRPQHISVLGGFRAQGRTASQARMIIEDALAVQKAGAFAVVLECVPSAVAKAVTELLKIPTIGIGAGPETDGQVLVFHDLLGMLQHPHHAQFVPKFCKRYADVGEQIRVGLENYRDDVETGRFSSEAFSPYKMSKEETQKLHDMMATEYSHKDDDEDDGATHSEKCKAVWERRVVVVAFSLVFDVIGGHKSWSTVWKHSAFSRLNAHVEMTARLEAWLPCLLFLQCCHRCFAPFPANSACFRVRNIGSGDRCSELSSERQERSQWLRLVGHRVLQLVGDKLNSTLDVTEALFLQVI